MRFEVLCLRQPLSLRTALLGGKAGGVGFDLHFLRSNDMEHLFRFFVPLGFLLGKCLIQSLPILWWMV